MPIVLILMVVIQWLNNRKEKDWTIHAYSIQLAKDKIPKLIDSGACVAMPLLLSSRALSYVYPCIRLDPLEVDNPCAQVNFANGPSMSILGT